MCARHLRHSALAEINRIFSGTGNAVRVELPGSHAKQMVGLFFENVEPVISHNFSLASS